jgi:hypothetical protein
MTYDRGQKIAANQKCRCGHLGMVHEPGYLGLAVGHGKCGVSGCACEKFTWAGWVSQADADAMKGEGS